MEGHRGLPSVADMQGKSRPCLQPCSRAHWGDIFGLPPSRVAVFAPLPQNQYPGLG